MMRDFAEILARVVSSACAVLLFCGMAAAQNGSIEGRVSAAGSGERLVGANLSIVGTRLGAATDAKGQFKIAGVPPGQYSLRVTFIGYKSLTRDLQVTAGQSVAVDFALNEEAVFGNELVVTASRRAEKVTEAPASISVVNADELARGTALTYGEAMAKAKGVDFYRTGVDGVGINARGFMTAYSYRMQLMADGKNAMLPGAGLAAGNLFPVAREDVARIETVLGPSSALYGPNAHNGLVNIVTKHPRDFPGTIVAVGGGENSIVTGRVRHARVLNDQLSYKVNAEYMQGHDWVTNNVVGFDNSGKAYKEDPDPDLKSARFSGAAYWEVIPTYELSVEGGYSRVNSIGTTNVGRNQIVDWTYDYQQLRLSSPHFFAQAYRTGNHAGDTHSIENRISYQIAMANAGRSVTRQQAIDAIKFVDDSKRYDFEAQYNTTISGVRFVAGGNYEDNRPVSNGTYLSDTTGTLKIRQGGVYGQVEYEAGARWKFVGAARYDWHDNYDSQFSPRLAAVYKMPGFGSFRATFNRAFQAPAILQQELYLPSGSVSGLPIVLRGNGHGFTFSDGSSISPLEPETNTTYEVGYKGIVSSRLYLDVNVYRSRYKNFISPLTVISNFAAGVIPVKQGNVALPTELVLTYRNFGKVNVDGVDIGLNLQMSAGSMFWFNYSYIKPIDLDDPANDFNKDGNFEELSFNTPRFKFNTGIALNDFLIHDLFASLAMRHVEPYDFISGRHRATAAGKGNVSPLGLHFIDGGPLGDFYTFDLNFSYRLQQGVQLNVAVSNLFNKPLREMVASPAIRRLVTAEVRYTF